MIRLANFEAQINRKIVDRGFDYFMENEVDQLVKNGDD